MTAKPGRRAGPAFRETTDAELEALERVGRPGRPSLGPGKGRQGGRVAYRVDSTLLEAAQAEAKRRGLELGTFARHALAEYLVATAPRSVTARMRYVQLRQAVPPKS